jgi:hypothetical protein
VSRTDALSSDGEHRGVFDDGVRVALAVVVPRAGRGRGVVAAAMSARGAVGVEEWAGECAGPPPEHADSASIAIDAAAAPRDNSIAFTNSETLGGRSALELGLPELVNSDLLTIWGTMRRQ